MKRPAAPTLLDHFLVARVQSRITGADAHDVHAMLGKYYCLCELAADDASFRAPLDETERSLRAFCDRCAAERWQTSDRS